MEINVGAKVIGVCVSGGVDSMVLLDILRKKNITVHVLHVHHGLRAQSDDELAMIRTYCQKYQLTLWTKHIDKHQFKKDKSIQQEARALRYHFFNEIASKQNLEMLFTAHHKDDQQETIMFRLLTGRLHQPLGIESHRTINGVHYHRPLLNIDKAALYEYAERNNVPFYEDDSNKDSKYDRNFIRNEVLPLISSRFDIDHLNEWMEWHQSARTLIEQQSMSFSTDDNELSRTQLIKAHPLVQQEVLRKWISTFTEKYDISTKFLMALLQGIQTNGNKVIPVNDNWHIYVLYDKLIIRNNNQNHINEMHLSFPGKYDFNGYSVIYEGHEHIILRTKQDGDKIKINNQHQKVSTILKDNKVPVYERERMPLVVDQGEIIKVGHIKANQHPINKMMIINKEN